ncbi:MAG: galactokinase family protein [Clostridia bacterium]
MTVRVSAPSRLCLFGEHLDYHHLEVVTMAIDLRFHAEISARNDGLGVIEIKDETIDTLNQENTWKRYERFEFDLASELIYTGSRDYFKSCFNVIKRRGYDISSGFDIKMDSEIPIGKGMCSSSAMVVTLIKAVLECIDADIKDSGSEIAQMGYEAEVSEFNEPGGKMDHMASAYGGIRRFGFSDIKNPTMEALGNLPTGEFILFDSLQRKDTIKVLETARKPVEEAVRLLGLKSIAEIGIKALGESNIPIGYKNPAMAALYNYDILKQFLSMHLSGTITPEQFGEMLYRHHCRLRDGLGISTDSIEEILDTAMHNGALGGKLNGTGGGGCCYVFCHEKDAGRIIGSVGAKGYPGRIVKTAGEVAAEKGGCA